MTKAPQNNADRPASSYPQQLSDTLSGMKSAPRLPALPSTDAAVRAALGDEPLGEVLHHLRLTGTLYCSTEVRGAQGIVIPAFAGVMMLQVVTEGRVLLEIPDEPPRWVGAGSLALLPRGEGHVVRTAVDSPLLPLEEVEVTPIGANYETATLGTEGELTRLTYGVLRFDHVAATRVVSQLPRVIIVDALESERADWLASTLRVVAREARHPRPGGEEIITRLADVLVVETLRIWLEGERAERGWIAALRDARVGKALAALHRHPANAWSLATLAKEAGMSRSSFAERFHTLVGEPPMSYLADWRLRSARELLRGSELSLSEVATRVGYASEAAFGRAYKRAFAISPGRDRQA